MGERRAHMAAYLRSRRRLAARWRAAHRPEPGVADGIEGFRRRFELPGADDDPVFVLSCGWRSGSTLLQRLVVASGQVLVWGEPYRQADLVGRLSASLRLSATLPGDDDILALDGLAAPDELAGRWIATLCPHPAHLLEAHRALFRRLYAEPALGAGYPRWGFKEVRLGVDDALYLRLLFPQARIVFLHRNPYDAWASFRQNHRGNHFRDGRRVWTARRFGQVWAQLVRDAVTRAHLVDGLVVGYDDLVTGAALPALSHHLRVELSPEVLEVRVGASRRRGSFGDRLPPLGLTRAVEPLAAALGYRPTPARRAHAA